MKDDDTGFPDNDMAIYTPQERELIWLRVNHSTEKDYDGSRRVYADQVSTSQALKNRARAHLNGHN